MIESVTLVFGDRLLPDPAAYENACVVLYALSGAVGALAGEGEP